MIVVIFYDSRQSFILFSNMPKLICPKLICPKFVSQIEDMLTRDPVLARLRSQAKPPPELLEPLFAFHGTTRYSFNSINRLEQKLGGIDLFMNNLDRLGENRTNWDKLGQVGTLQIIVNLVLSFRTPFTSKTIG